MAIILDVVYNGIPRAIAQVTAGVELAKEAGKEAIAERARLEVPVLTGALRDSIQITEEGVEAGTGLDYAGYVHFGTSKMAGTPYLSVAVPGGERAMQRVLNSLLRH
jgi:HK97 gp10 family phage protein